MSYIKVWCEYDIAGQFSGNSNEDIFEVDDNLTNEQVSELVENEFAGLWLEVNEEDGEEPEETFLESGLLGWEYVIVNKLGE